MKRENLSIKKGRQIARNLDEAIQKLKWIDGMLEEDTRYDLNHVLRENISIGRQLDILREFLDNFDFNLTIPNFKYKKFK